MNLIQFTHYGEPLNAYFNLNDKGNLSTLRVTRGAYKDEAFDLSEGDALMIQDAIEQEIYLSLQEFEVISKAHQA